jgi:hypothetical protein
VVAERPHHHATVVAGVLDVRSGELQLANAGHVPPLVVDRTGRAELVDGWRGPMLGALADQDYPEQQRRLGGDDALVLFTDGLVERRQGTLDEALAHLCQAVAQAPPCGEDLQRWCDELIDRQVRASDLDDDTCVLVLRPAHAPVETGTDPAAVGGAVEGDGPGLLHLDLEPAPGSARTVRRWLAATFADHPRLAELQLCATEVVTNAVIHAGTPFSVTVHQLGSRIRVAVSDSSPVWPQRRPHRSTAPRGRGLQLIEALTAAWGTDAVAGGKVVWFDLDVAPPGR